MLSEAVDIIRLLWQGGSRSHHGRHYDVENARIYTLPAQPVPLLILASGRHSAELAVAKGDGLIAFAAEGEHVQTFGARGASGKPRYGQVTVCYAADEAEAKKTAAKLWPNAALGGELTQELPVPAHFEQATSWVDDERISRSIVCGPDPRAHIQAILEFARTGLTHVYVHQVGPDQQGFFNFYRQEVLPALGAGEALEGSASGEFAAEGASVGNT